VPREQNEFNHERPLQYVLACRSWYYDVRIKGLALMQKLRIVGKSRPFTNCRDMARE
jgi:hypothetical protein